MVPLTERQFEEIKYRLPSKIYIKFKPDGSQRTYKEIDKLLISIYKIHREEQEADTIYEIYEDIEFEKMTKEIIQDWQDLKNKIGK